MTTTRGRSGPSASGRINFLRSRGRPEGQARAGGRTRQGFARREVVGLIVPWRRVLSDEHERTQRIPVFGEQHVDAQLLAGGEHCDAERERHRDVLQRAEGHGVAAVQRPALEIRVDVTEEEARLVDLESLARGRGPDDRGVLVEERVERLVDLGVEEAEKCDAENVAAGGVGSMESWAAVPAPAPFRSRPPTFKKASSSKTSPPAPIWSVWPWSEPPSRLGPNGVNEIARASAARTNTPRPSNSNSSHERTSTPPCVDSKVQGGLRGKKSPIGTTRPLGGHAGATGVVPE